MPRFVSVAVPVPFLDLLTYRVPDEMTLPVRGARVRVPLGTRIVAGITVGQAESGDHPAIKDVIEVLPAGRQSEGLMGTDQKCDAGGCRLRLPGSGRARTRASHRRRKRDVQGKSR